jgi:hypothetical protein
MKEREVEPRPKTAGGPAGRGACPICGGRSDLPCPMPEHIAAADRRDAPEPKAKGPNPQNSTPNTPKGTP